MQLPKPIKVSPIVDENPIFENGKEDQPLSPMSRLFHEPESNLYIVVMIGFKSKTNPDFVKANLGHSLLKHHRFSSLQVQNMTNKLITSLRRDHLKILGYIHFFLKAEACEQPFNLSLTTRVRTQLGMGTFGLNSYRTCEEKILLLINR